MKIMLKETEDVETQTEGLQSRDGSNSLKYIELGSRVEEGQTRIFVPYSAGTYIIANPS